MRELASFRPEIRDYLIGGASKSLLLIGDYKMGILKDAVDTASFLLSVENPELSQDYMFIGLGEGEKSLGVKVSEAVIERSLLLPASANKGVVVIDSFNLMTVPAQNKLLKLIEESETTVIIAVAYEDTVLPTIKSRMGVVRYSPLSMEQFEHYCRENGVDEPLVMYYLTGGIAGNIEAVDKSSEVYKAFEAVRGALSSKGMSGIGNAMSALHMVKEKDKNAFYENHRDLAGKMLSLVTYSILQSEGVSDKTRHMLDVYNREISRVSSVSYTKDDFMGFFVEIM